MAKRFRRYRLLLDEGLPFCKRFPESNKRHDLKHITHDLGLSGLEDFDVYKTAIKHRRLLVIYNKKDFIKIYSELAETSKESGIIGLTQEATYSHKDKQIVALLKNKKKSELYGKYTVLTGARIK